MDFRRLFQKAVQNLSFVAAKNFQFFARFDPKIIHSLLSEATIAKLKVLRNGKII
jgi:hypothetical protein